MLVILVVAIGVVVGVVAHLILGEDGYSWFGEIILAIAGATLLGLLMGILAGARTAGFDAFLAGTGTFQLGVALQIVVGAIAGAAIADGIVVWLTFRATGRRFGQPSQ